jgi:glycerol-3-phosphate acyltransferase PlsY
MPASLLVAAVAYLLGSIPFGLVLMAVFRRQDIRLQGSGNIGATNVVRAGGKGLGAATFALDALKGFLAVGFAQALALHQHMPQPQAQNLVAIAAIAAFAGHLFPVWLGFRGGKGVATGFGVFLGIAPYPALLALLMFLAVFMMTRFVSLASVVAAATFPVAMLLKARGLTTLMTVAVVALPLLIIVKHHANIRRLLNGTEYRFGRPKAQA